MVYSKYLNTEGDDTNLNDSFRKLRGKILEKYGNAGKFADEIGCSRQMVSRKLNNKSDMSRTDILLWLKKLDIPESEVHEYFF